jgi:type II secretory pathway pseudopilin PulG
MTLVEALIAVAILGIAVTAVMPAFMSLMDVNTRDEERSGALAATQHVLEELRHDDPATMPDSGADPLQLIVIDGREYEVLVRYCTTAAYCGDDSRHLLVEVSYGGREIAAVESVFTRLR